MAIAVFYIKRKGEPLGISEIETLRERLLSAIAANLG